MDKDTKDEKPAKMWKLEGEAFEKVKAAHEEAFIAAKEAQRIADEKKKAMWDIIQEAIPEAKFGSGDYNLNTDCEALGFYVVKGSECDHGKGLLGALLAAAGKAS